MANVSGRMMAALLGLVCAVPAGFGANALAQGAAVPNPAPAAAAAAKGAETRTKRANRSRGAKAEAPAEPAIPVALPPPPPPDWPVNDKAVPASVDWNGRVLSVSATNSSLQQILSDVATATGVKVEGIPSDQRVYGSFGPAPARDVLSQLLDGSGYNVLMIGDRGEGTPRTLVLTVKNTSAAPNPGIAQARPNAEEEAPEEPEPIEQPDPALHRSPGMNPMGRNPLQMRQEIDRIQQQQQQQGTQVQPPVTAPPPNQ